MDNFVIGNIVWNAGLVALAGFFVRRWMGDVEDGRKTNAKRIEEGTEWTRKELEKTNDRTTAEIKEAIHENRVEYARQSSEIKDSINALSAHIAVSNGRTGKLEERIAVQIALCQLRNKDRLPYDPCDQRAD